MPQKEFAELTAIATIRYSHQIGFSQHFLIVLKVKILKFSFWESLNFILTIEIYDPHYLVTKKGAHKERLLIQPRIVLISAIFLKLPAETFRLGMERLKHFPELFRRFAHTYLRHISCGFGCINKLSGYRPPSGT